MKTNYSPFNQKMLKKFHQSKIKNELMKIPRPYCMYGETHIMQSFNFCYDLKFAESFPEKVYSLEIDHEAIDLDTSPNIVFFIYPQPEMIKVIASMILKNETALIKKSYWLFFVPFCNYLCKEKLEELSIYQKVSIVDFHSGLIPLTESLFSLQLWPMLDPIE